MKAGKLIHLIEVQQVTTTFSEAGTPAHVWSHLMSTRAERVAQETSEFIRGYGASDETVAVFRTRYLDGITTAHRIAFDGQVFNIKEVMQLGRRQGLELRCVAMSGVT